jgi:uncharacterized repeat protein (TIGR01451 family)
VRQTLTFITILLVAMIFMTAGAAVAVPAMGETPPAERLYEGIEAVPYLAGSAPPDSSLSVQQPEVVLPGSEIVYQSLRDNNWDIYRGNDDGSGQFRLTNHLFADIAPRLNRGATRVAFSSNRDGSGYHIYTMNVDGSGLAQLTSGPYNNTNPDWSPDGSTIVFESYRDGQPEIYVMNGDGSNQTRLTNHGDFDGQPVWSPNGSQIAFSSRRDGFYRIYVMNSDGSGQTQRSNQPYSFHPAWSPDGSRLAYDADQDGDGWQDIWTMTADGSNQQLVYNVPDYQTDGWVRSWSPDGRYIAFTRISFVVYQGNLYWTRAYLDAFDTVTGIAFRLSPEETNWYPDWRSTDLLPPYSAVNSLSPYTRLAHAAIQWAGSDVGPAGINNYDVQYRTLPNGAWTNWQMQTASTSAFYGGTAGSMVAFRSRAYDRASNVENWPVSFDTQTTFYSWNLSGRISDNRGAPLTNVPLLIAPGTLQNTATGPTGAYNAYLLAEGAHTLNVNHPGYAAVPATTFSVYKDMAQNFYLRPGNDVSQNGTFEAHPQQLVNWTAAGSIPAVVTNTQRASGSNAASLGQSCPFPCLSPAEVIFDTPYHMSDMAVDSHGNLHMVFFKANHGFYYSRKNQGSDTWSDPYQFAVSDEDSLWPILAVDRYDNVHIVWFVIQPTRSYYVQLSAAGVWSAPTQFSTGFGQVARIVADQQGRVHVITHGSNALYHLERLPNGVWLPAVAVSQTANYQSMGPVLAVDSDNTLWVAWRSQSASNDYALMYRVRLPNGIWGPIELLYPQIEHGPNWPRVLLIGPDRAVHLLWWDYASQEGRHGIWQPGSGWGNLLTIPYVSGKATFDDLGILHLVARRDVTDEGFYYSRYIPSVGWSHKSFSVLIDNNPLIAIDQYDAIHIVWDDDEGNFHYMTSLPAANSAVGSIQQNVTIPADMHQPTLSFMAKVYRDLPGDASNIQIAVNNGVTQTETLIEAADMAWRQHWLDMRPWSGQMVTVTFTLNQGAGDPYLRLYLDDVSLGSTYPDVMVAPANSPTALPGETVTFQLTFGNQGSVPADGSVLTVTLPAELSYVSASLPPIATTPSLVWDLGNLGANSGSSTILLTVAVSPSAVPLSNLTTMLTISTAAPEVETANNSYMVKTLVGGRLYLPMMVR